jgi:hypothetical protein
MDVHFVDGTYELFRHFYIVPAAQDVSGREIGAVRAVLRSVLSMIEQGATHIGVATDHVVESFRNDLYAGYKTSAGVPPTLLSQFPVLEEALDGMGVMVWPMVEYEADDALASAAAKAARDDRVRQVIICTPDKDLAQCVRGTRVVQLVALASTQPSVSSRHGIAGKRAGRHWGALPLRGSRSLFVPKAGENRVVIAFGERDYTEHSVPSGYDAARGKSAPGHRRSAKSYSPKPLR